MASSTYLTSGIVLKRRDYREYDRLVTIYTDKYGKIETVARGVRKIVSKLAGHLEPLSYSSFMLAKGRAFDVLASSVRQSSFRIPQTDLLAFALACYFFEAVDRLTRPNLPDRVLFQLLVEYLEVFEATVEEGNRATAFQRVLITEFYLFQLLKQLGYTPALEKCVVGGERLRASSIALSLSHGGLVCDKHKRQQEDTIDLSLQAVEILRLMSDGDREPIRLMKQEDGALRQIALVMNSFLKYHIGEPLRSESYLATWLYP